MWWPAKLSACWFTGAVNVRLLGFANADYKIQHATS